ncbi:MAG: hypothetical protein ACLFV4_00870 [Candidatus Hydrogenedentota bacterium]
MKKLFATWRFRSSKPAFEAGQVVSLYITGFELDTNVAVARVGDSILTVHGAHPADIDCLVQLRVDDFDHDQSTGAAQLIRE